MQYEIYGSKNRHAKEILSIVLKNRKPNQYYAEPFVGGANVIDKVDGNRIAGDINKYLIAMYNAINWGWMPADNYTEEQYKYIMNNKEVSRPELVGYFGFALSYGGKWFGGWCRDGQGKRNYVKESYNNAIKQFPKLININFFCCTYDMLYIPENSIIYCDPPYAGTTKYTSDFDHEKLWEWVRVMSKQGHQVFVSEYNAPDDFECLWQKEVNSSLTQDTGSKKNIEKLFKYKG